MSLNVEVYYYDDEQQTRHYLAVDYSQTLVGFETTRLGLWGSGAAIRLGLRVLLRLREEASLWVEGDDLNILLVECNSILENLADFAHATGYGADYIQFRVNNIRQAVTDAIGFLEKGIVAGVEIA